MFEMRSEAYFIYLEKIRIFVMFSSKRTQNDAPSAYEYACPPDGSAFVDEFRSKQDNNNNNNNHNSNNSLVLRKLHRNSEESQRMMTSLGVATICSFSFFAKGSLINDVT